MAHEIIGYRDRHDPDQEMIWAAYERTGSLRQTAATLEMSYSRVRRVLTEDLIRLNDIRLARSEESIRRWEDKEAHAAIMANQLMDSIQMVLDHIEECAEKGEPETNLVDPALSFRGKDVGVIYMTPLRARQWLMETRQLESMSKVGINAAKSVEQQRTALMHGIVGREAALRQNQAGDPGGVSDQELLVMVSRLEAAGETIPEPVRRWAEQRRKAELPPSGHPPTPSG